jgi:hypothetical protein
MSPLLDARDVRTTWAHVGTDGVGGASRSSDVESERVSHAKRNRCGMWGAASERGPHARRPVLVVLLVLNRDQSATLALFVFSQIKSTVAWLFMAVRFDPDASPLRGSSIDAIPHSHSSTRPDPNSLSTSSSLASLKKKKL